MIDTLNEAQRIAFDAVINAIDGNEGKENIFC